MERDREGEEGSENPTAVVGGVGVRRTAAVQRPGALPLRVGSAGVEGSFEEAVGVDSRSGLEGGRWDCGCLDRGEGKG